jgi:hypothetical protein
MSDVNSTLAEKFSLTRGGPLDRILDRLDHAKDERRHVVVRALLVILITWLPLFVLSLIQGLAYGNQVKIPFLHDFAVNVRFFVALPILILAESGINKTWRNLVLYFLKSGLVDQNKLPSFEAVLEGVLRLRDRLLPEAILLILAFVPSIFIVKTELLMGGITNWHLTDLGSNKASMAGWWFNLISVPLFRFVLLRWMWRMFLWTLFLWRVSRIHLYLVATHTDMAAGLGFLTSGQKAFGPIVFAGGAVIAAQIGNAIAYEGETLSSLRSQTIAYAIIATFLLAVPLLVVAPVLREVKRKALREYGALVTTHNQSFETKWILNKHSEGGELLGNPDASSLVDLGDSFTVVRRMRIVPIGRQTLLTLAAAAALPMLPVVFLVTPFDEVLRTILKMLG